MIDSLERILGTYKFRSLKPVERTRIEELIVANPVYAFLVSGIMNDPNRRLVLGEAYLKFVRSDRPSRHSKRAQAGHVEKSTQIKEIIFGVSSADQSNFTKSVMM